MPSSPTRSPLLYADTHSSADALYFGRVEVPDAFIAFGHGRKKYAVVSALEFGRVKRTSSFDRVLSLETLTVEARAAWPGQKVGAPEVVVLLARKFGIKRFTVSPLFAAGTYHRLQALGLAIDIADGPLFPAREVKSAAEAAAIKEGNRCSALGIGAAEQLLRRSRVRAGRLFFEGRPLTSERLKLAIESACLEGGAISANTIAAGGNQGCDPHDRGSGPLRAHELIVVDVFPRVSASGYFGDMTRTFLRGRASEAQRALVSAVREAQRAALAKIRPGVSGREVHAQAVAVFTAQGFATKHTAQGSVGFFHGTGHGLGLEIHEPPRLGPTSDSVLLKGTVVTVEPGLYYPGIGGCRIEDVVQVTDRAPRMLSHFHYDWELR